MDDSSLEVASDQGFLGSAGAGVAGAFDCGCGVLDCGVVDCGVVGAGVVGAVFAGADFVAGAGLENFCRMEPPVSARSTRRTKASAQIMNMMAHHVVARDRRVAAPRG